MTRKFDFAGFGSDVSQRDAIMSAVSDAHKDAYGVRFRDFEGMSDTDLIELFDHCVEAINAEFRWKEEVRAEERRILREGCGARLRTSLEYALSNAIAIVLD